MSYWLSNFFHGRFSQPFPNPLSGLALPSSKQKNCKKVSTLQAWNSSSVNICDLSPVEYWTENNQHI